MNKQAPVGFGKMQGVLRDEADELLEMDLIRFAARGLLPPREQTNGIVGASGKASPVKKRGRKAQRKARRKGRA